MIRILVIFAVLLITAYIIRSVWRSVMQLRVGAVPDDIDVPEVTMVPDRGWQVTRSVVDGVATVRVEHPIEGTQRTWIIRLREPGAAGQLDEAMRKAGIMVHDLSRIN